VLSQRHFVDNQSELAAGAVDGELVDSAKFIHG
jgi:hypothetical protein